MSDKKRIDRLEEENTNINIYRYGGNYMIYCSGEWGKGKSLRAAMNDVIAKLESGNDE